MADTAGTTPQNGDVKDDQVAQLKSYLKTIMAKQEELKAALGKKHDKAVAARRLSAQGQSSLRNVMVDMDTSADGKTSHTIEVVETPGMEKRLENYAHNVEELEKELEETTKLVNEVVTALAVITAQAGQT